jgi:hypothetical protein
MSLDAEYIFVYENLGYLPPTPMDKDIFYLENFYGGKFVKITETTIYWDKPKYTLSADEFSKLYADQILERKTCELWEIVK